MIDLLKKITTKCYSLLTLTCVAFATIVCGIALALPSYAHASVPINRDYTYDTVPNSEDGGVYITKTDWTDGKVIRLADDLRVQTGMLDSAGNYTQWVIATKYGVWGGESDGFSIKWENVGFDPITGDALDMVLDDYSITAKQGSGAPDMTGAFVSVYINDTGTKFGELSTGYPYYRVNNEVDNAIYGKLSPSDPYTEDWTGNNGNGIRHKFKVYLYKHGTNEEVKKSFKMDVLDIDIYGHKYAERFGFVTSQHKNAVYIGENSELSIVEDSDGLTKFISTNYSNHSGSGYDPYADWGQCGLTTWVKSGDTMFYGGHDCGIWLTFESKTVVSPSIPAPVKSVQEKIAHWGEPVHFNTKVTYPKTISQNRFKALGFVDTLDKRLDAANATLQVIDRKGNDVTSWFNISKSGQTITANVKSDKLDDVALTYTFKITATLNREYPRLHPEDAMKDIPNVAHVTATTFLNKKKDIPSNEVTVPPIEPVIKARVHKTAL